MSLKLKEGAFVVADAHYSPTLRPELLAFFQAIEKEQLQPTQLILMGDIFDALFGSIEFTFKQNEQILQVLYGIASKIEVVLLEGNHDFNLTNKLQNIKVYPMGMQPLQCSYGEKTLYLAHGDFDAPFGYKLYSAIIRNAVVLKVLNFIDKRNSDNIIKKIEEYLTKKDDCKEFVGFESFIEKRNLENFKADYFIEGHYHQNKSMQLKKLHYINLGAFACNQRYFVVKSSQDKELLEEKSFFKR